MIHGIEQRDVVPPEQAGEHADVHAIARREDECGIAFHEARQLVFEFDVDIEGAVEQSGAGAAGAAMDYACATGRG